MVRSGRPRTGRTTSTVTVRLPAAAYQTLLLQARGQGKGISTCARDMLLVGMNLSEAIWDLPDRGVEEDFHDATI